MCRWSARIANAASADRSSHGHLGRAFGAGLFCRGLVSSGVASWHMGKAGSGYVMFGRSGSVGADVGVADSSDTDAV